MPYLLLFFARFLDHWFLSGGHYDVISTLRSLFLLGGVRAAWRSWLSGQWPWHCESHLSVFFKNSVNKQQNSRTVLEYCAKFGYPVYSKRILLNKWVLGCSDNVYLSAQVGRGGSALTRALVRLARPGLLTTEAVPDALVWWDWAAAVDVTSFTLPSFNSVSCCCIRSINTAVVTFNSFAHCFKCVFRDWKQTQSWTNLTAKSQETHSSL